MVACESVLGQVTPPLRLSDHAVVRHLDLAPVPESVSVARRFAREVLATTEAEAEHFHVAELLVSELVTNAILHARTELQLCLAVDGEQVLVCVADRAADTPALAPQSQSRTRPGGRGLALVADLSKAWGTARYSSGKTVWFLLQVATRSLRVG